MTAEAREQRIRRLAALALFCVAGILAGYLIFVRTRNGQHADDAALTGRAVAARGEGAFERLLNTISVGSILVALALLCGQALLRRRVDLSLIAATVIAGSALSAELLKHVILSRPTLFVGPLPHSSYPSGHTAIAFSIGVAAMLVVPSAWRTRTAVIAVLYGSAIGIATVAAGWHRPSDAAASMLLVIAWASATCAVAAMLARADRMPTGEWPQPAPTRRYVFAGIALLSAGYVAAVAVAIAKEAGAIDWTLGNAAFLAACAILLGLASVLMIALLAALSPGSRGDITG